MMATVPQVTSGSGLRKLQADGFLFDRAYICDNILLNSSYLYTKKYFRQNLCRKLHFLFYVQ